MNTRNNYRLSTYIKTHENGRTITEEKADRHMSPVCCYFHCKSSLPEMCGVQLIYALGLSVY
jgi:hypothetical protein